MTTDALRAAAETALAAYQHRFESVAPQIGNYCGPIDEEMLALRAALAAPVQEPMFWVRLRSDDGYEGPIHNSSIEEARKRSGAWSPLYLGAAPQAAPAVPAAVQTLYDALSDVLYEHQCNGCISAETESRVSTLMHLTMQAARPQAGQAGQGGEG